MTGDEKLAIEIEQMRRDLARLADLIAPYIGQDEMQNRYGVTGQTLLAMERRKEIPQRVKGRWVRSEVLAWERMIVSPKTPHNPAANRMNA